MYYLVDIAANQKNYGSTTTEQNGGSPSPTSDEPPFCNLLPSGNPCGGGGMSENGSTAEHQAHPPVVVGPADYNNHEHSHLLPRRPSHDDATPPRSAPPQQQYVYMQQYQYQQQSAASHSSPPTATIMSIDQALELLGMGRIQYEIMLAAGLCFMADASEVWILSFLSYVLTNHWNLTFHQSVMWIPSVIFPGSMMGAIVLGYAADRVGRRPIFCAGAIMICLFGWASAAVTSLQWLLVTRLLVGFGVGGLTVPFDTLAEFLPHSQARGRYLLYTRLFWTAGVLVVPLCLQPEHAIHAKDDDSWRPVVILCTLPCILSAVLGLLWVPESPRWLLAQGRHEEALHVLRQAATVNGHVDPFRLFPVGTMLLHRQSSSGNNTIKRGRRQHPKKIVVSRTRSNDNTNMDDNQDNNNHMFAPQWRKTTLALFGTYFGLSFLYHGMITLAVYVFSDNDGPHGQYRTDYKAISTTVLSETLGVFMALATIDTWGRNPTQNIAYICAGVGCLVVSLLLYNPNIEDSDGRILILLAFCQWYLYSGNCVTWVATVEILPTSFRATGHAFCSAVGRAGGLLSWYIITQMNHYYYLQQQQNGDSNDEINNDNDMDRKTALPTIGFMLFLMGIWTVVCSWQLPETQGEDLGSAHAAGSLLHQLY